MARRALGFTVALVATLSVFIGLALWAGSLQRPAPFVSPLTSPLVPQVKTPTPAPTPDGGMLQNSSMEESYPCVPGQTSYCVPHDWQSWRVESVCRPGRPGCDIPCPLTCLNDRGYCVADTGCYWATAEFTSIGLDHPERVHSGSYALKIFHSGRMWEGGVYQQVYHVPIRSLVTFSVWAHAWQCHNYDNCDGGRVSDYPANMNISVGVDPTGGTDPNSPDIVWHTGESFDTYSQFSVSTLARNQVVTLFIRGAPRWWWPRNNGNDLYVDDASLTIQVVDWRYFLFLPDVRR